MLALYEPLVGVLALADDARQGGIRQADDGKGDCCELLGWCKNVMLRLGAVPGKRGAWVFQQIGMCCSAPLLCVHGSCPHRLLGVGERDGRVQRALHAGDGAQRAPVVRELERALLQVQRQRHLAAPLAEHKHGAGLAWGGGYRGSGVGSINGRPSLRPKQLQTFTIQLRAQTIAAADHQALK